MPTGATTERREDERDDQGANTYAHESHLRVDAGDGPRHRGRPDEPSDCGHDAEEK
jgi:hypothetical protein